MIKQTMLTVLCLAWVPAADAMTIMEQEFTCPIDGTTFTTTVQSSGFSSGAYFDLQLVGAIMSPSPLPECPGTGFVIDEGHDYTPAEVTRLKAWVATPEYRVLAERETPYYLLAQQRLLLGQSRADVATLLLAATWQAGDRYTRYALEALDAMRARADSQAGTPGRFHSLLLVGELQRRLGKFEDAARTFDALAADPGFPGQQRDDTNAHLRALLAAQRALVKARDARHVGFDREGKVSDFPG